MSIIQNSINLLVMGLFFLLVSSASAENTVPPSVENTATSADDSCYHKVEEAMLKLEGTGEIVSIDYNDDKALSYNLKVYTVEMQPASMSDDAIGFAGIMTFFVIVSSAPSFTFTPEEKLQGPTSCDIESIIFGHQAM